jgi:hypothetical protein
MNISEYVQIKKDVKRCIECGEVIPSDSSRFSVRKFCSKKCNRKHFSLKRYHKIKNSGEYKKHRKEYYKKWVEKNRTKFNDYMRNYMRDAAQRYKKKKTIIFNKDNNLNKQKIDTKGG